MHISQESTDRNTVQAYSESAIQIRSHSYTHSLIVNTVDEPIAWAIDSLASLDVAGLAPLLESGPEIIIIGHQTPGKFAPLETREHLSQQRIGLESMSIGAACRTFNVLLSEGRKVVLGVILG